MGELVGQVAALDQEGARPAAHVPAVLAEAHLCAFGHGDEEALLVVLQKVTGVAAVEEAVRDVAGDREVAEAPDLEGTGEGRPGTECQLERKIGPVDRLAPGTLALGRFGVRGRERGSHRPILLMPCTARG
jgi:hypothetical protein